MIQYYPHTKVRGLKYYFRSQKQTQIVVNRQTLNLSKLLNSQTQIMNFACLIGQYLNRSYHLCLSIVLCKLSRRGTEKLKYPSIICPITAVRINKELRYCKSCNRKHLVKAQYCYKCNRLDIISPLGIVHKLRNLSEGAAKPSEILHIL